MNANQVAILLIWAGLTSTNLWLQWAHCRALRYAMPRYIWIGVGLYTCLAMLCVWRLA